MKCFALGALIVTLGPVAASWTNMHLSESDGCVENIAFVRPTFDGEAADPSNGYDACATMWSPP
jgi:hypothetical protein